MNGHELLTAATCGCRDKPGELCRVCDMALDICRNCGAAEIELQQPCAFDAFIRVRMGALNFASETHSTQRLVADAFRAGTRAAVRA